MYLLKHAQIIKVQEISRFDYITIHKKKKNLLRTKRKVNFRADAYFRSYSLVYGF